jgi:hypothetical protein
MVAGTVAMAATAAMVAVTGNRANCVGVHRFAFSRRSALRNRRLIFFAAFASRFTGKGRATG